MNFSPRANQNRCLQIRHDLKVGLVFCHEFLAHSSFWAKNTYVMHFGNLTTYICSVMLFLVPLSNLSFLYSRNEMTYLKKHTLYLNVYLTLLCLKIFCQKCNGGQTASSTWLSHSQHTRTFYIYPLAFFPLQSNINRVNNKLLHQKFQYLKHFSGCL